ncbi:MAG: hypothetical protein IPL52_05765 [Flavobacteriales bacterium]|nr:hypothetical protein [Flavobacteriales bacterium]
MKRVFVSYLVSGVAVLIGYETFRWSVDQRSLIWLFLPIVLILFLAFVLVYLLSRRFALTNHGSTKLNVGQVDRWFLGGGLVLNSLLLLWMIIEHVSFVQGFKDIDL